MNALRSSLNQRVIFFFILLLAIVLRLACFRGFGAVDDAEYARFAYKLTQGIYHTWNYDGPPVFPLRLGIIIPTALFFHTLGTHEWSMILYPLILSIMGMPLVYICAKYFFGHSAGMVAAVLWAVLPIDVLHATILVPDPPSAFFIALAVVGILILERYETKNTFLLFSGGIFAGISFGISWLCKESALYIAPFGIILMVTSLRRNKKRNLSIWTGVVIGSAGVFFAEIYTYHRLTGDWLFRFHEIERNYLENKNAFFVEGGQFASTGGSGYVKAILKRILATGPLTILLNAQFIFFPLLGLMAALHALFWKDKAFIIPALWLISLIIMFNFASSSLSSYKPLVLFDRYLYPILLPATVLTAGFLAKLVFQRHEGHDSVLSKERLFWGIVLIVFIGVIGGNKVYQNTKWLPGWTSEVRTLSASLKPSDIIFTDILSIKGLEFFWHYPERTNTTNFEDMVSPSEIRPGTYVLLNQRYLDWLNSNAGWWPTKSSEYRKPEFNNQIPGNWKTIWRNGNASLYLVE